MLALLKVWTSIICQRRRDCIYQIKADHRIYIFGAGSLAKVLYGLLADQNSQVEGFVCDQPTETMLFGKKVWDYSAISEKLSAKQNLLLLAVGYKSLAAKAKLYERLQSDDVRIGNYVHPTAFIGKDATLGIGNLIFPGVVIEPNVKIGHGNVLWSQTTICHDSLIGDHNFFASGSVIGGEARIGDRNFFAFHSTLDSHATVSDDVTLGANSFGRGALREGALHVGTPAVAKKSPKVRVGER